MKCPYLKGTYLESCKATREVYVPSQFEFDEYCTHNGHKVCSLYTKSVSEGRPTVTADAEDLVSSAK